MKSVGVGLVIWSFIDIWFLDKGSYTCINMLKTCFSHKLAFCQVNETPIKQWLLLCRMCKAVQLGVVREWTVCRVVPGPMPMLIGKKQTYRKGLGILHLNGLISKRTEHPISVWIPCQCFRPSQFHADSVLNSTRVFFQWMSLHCHIPLGYIDFPTHPEKHRMHMEHLVTWIVCLLSPPDRLCADISAARPHPEDSVCTNEQ